MTKEQNFLDTFKVFCQTIFNVTCWKLFLTNSEVYIFQTYSEHAYKIIKINKCTFTSPPAFRTNKLENTLSLSHTHTHKRTHSLHTPTNSPKQKYTHLLARRILAAIKSFSNAIFTPFIKYSYCNNIFHAYTYSKFTFLIWTTFKNSKISFLLILLFLNTHALHPHDHATI